MHIPRGYQGKARGASGGNDFIERSLFGVLEFLKDSLFSEEYALRKGLLQSLDPRVKTLSFVFLLAAALFLKSIPVLIWLYLLCIFLACLSRISLGFFLKRTWVFMPLFSLFIAVPALFSAFSPGEPLLALNLWLLKLIITKQGLCAAGLFVTRVIASVSWVILLSLTTRHTVLLAVLRIFKVPQIFVATIGTCYRYIYLFAELIENTYLAVKSRVGARLHYRKGREVVAWKIAGLWQRSVYLNEAVYQAMLSRGYTGEPAVLAELKCTVLDWCWSFCVIIVSLLLYLMSRYG